MLRWYKATLYTISNKKHSTEILTSETVKEFLQKSTKKNIEIVTPSNFHKRIVNQVVQREFSALGCSTKRKFVEVMKLTVEQRQKNLSESRNQVQFKELDQLLGFSKIFNALAEAKKPLVGHNMYLGI
jgi:preprotein translocase subunit SecD